MVQGVHAELEVVLHRESDQAIENSAVRFHARIHHGSGLDCCSDASRFLETRGEGVHHVCLGVPSIDAKLAALDGDGVRLVSKEAEIGAEGCPVAFIHPKASRSGVLVELLEETGTP